ncbi:MAG: Two-component system sensor histidine kinase/response regulator, hybrid [Bacteriovoracaceae bacterium]|nr:Two-component system sensor histidine kinase/response regulator, hybrid [Bacteriovoracaceae bacterium]
MAISLWTPEVKEKFQAQLRTEGAIAYRWSCLLGAFLFFAGGFLDWFTSRPVFISLSLIRLFISIVCIGMYFTSKTQSARNHPYGYTLVFALLASLSITAMCLIQTGYQSPYYAGVCLVIVALGILFPYGVLATTIAIGICYLAYWIPVVIHAHFHFENTAILINNLFFLTLTGIIGITAAHIKISLKRELFLKLLGIEEAHLRLKEYDRLKSQFFSNISHELRTPLTLILGSVEKWNSTPKLVDEKSDLVGTIRSNALTVLKHVNDLLDLAKLEARKMVLKRSTVDLGELIKRNAGMFKILADEKKIDYQISVQDHWIASVDSEKIERILSNLLSNAFKFVPVGSQIKCSLVSDKNDLILEVEDNGTGIPTYLRERVFERFYQVDSGDSRSFGGTGLGLSIVKEFTELHGGEVHLLASQSGGARIVVRIPWFKPAENAISLRESEYLLTSLNENSVKSAQDLTRTQNQDLESFPSEGEMQSRILIIEDNFEMRKFLEDSLSLHFSVISFASAVNSLEKIRSLRPEVILSDLMLPGLSGAEFFKELRSDPDLQSIPVIFLTAKADDELRVQIIEQGAFDYLVKPFSIQELLVRLQNCLNFVRSRETLQKELKTKKSDLQALTGEIVLQKQELETAVQTALIARDDALDSSKAKTRFLNLVSHELRTPLSTVMMTAQFLYESLSGITDEKQKSLLETLLRASNSLKSLVETLLEYSRIQKGKFNPRLSSFYLSEFVHQVISEYRPLAESKGLLLKEFVDQDQLITCDSEMLRLILSNLVSNAIKYTKSGSISVETKLGSDSFQFSVIDTGIGIAPDYLDKIFEEFERAPGPQSFLPGLGLGLSLGKALISALGGKISVQSTLGEGTCFVVSIPDVYQESTDKKKMGT